MGDRSQRRREVVSAHAADWLIAVGLGLLHPLLWAYVALFVLLGAAICERVLPQAASGAFDAVVAHGLFAVLFSTLWPTTAFAVGVVAGLLLDWRNLSGLVPGLMSAAIAVLACHFQTTDLPAADILRTNLYAAGESVAFCLLGGAAGAWWRNRLPATRDRQREREEDSVL